MTLKQYFFSDYPPAVTTLACTTLFGMYMLGSALFYQFNDAPDHSMPADYNRYLIGYVQSHWQIRTVHWAEAKSL